MAIIPNYTITDSLKDSYYSQFVNESYASYGYLESGTVYISHVAQAYSVPLVQNDLEFATEYYPFHMFLFQLYEQQKTGYRQNLVLPASLVRGRIIENGIVSKHPFESLSLKSHNEQFNELIKFFNFNKTEWAEIFSVSRPTIYGWLKNEIKPTGDNANKISKFYSLMNSIDNRQKGDKLFRGYIHHHINTYNCSLYEVLKSDTLDDAKIPELLLVLSSLLEKSRQKQKELAELEKTGLSSDTTFNYNMNNLFS